MMFSSPSKHGCSRCRPGNGITARPLIPCIDLDQASEPGPRTRSACAYRYPETGCIRWPPGRTPGPRPAPGAERSRPPDQGRSLGQLEGDVPAMAGRLRGDPLRSMKWGYANHWRLLKNSSAKVGNAIMESRVVTIRIFLARLDCLANQCCVFNPRK